MSITYYYKWTRGISSDDSYCLKYMEWSKSKMTHKMLYKDKVCLRFITNACANIY